MILIIYCPKNERGKHEWELDKSSGDENGNKVLLRCRKCNMHIVNLPKKIYKEQREENQIE